MSKGFFVTFEGIDGSGKSTQLALTAKYLSKQGLSVITTKDPGGTPVGEQIRRLLLSKYKGNQEIDALTETFLYLASRRVLVTSVIKPALAQGRVVLCDRFTDSTLAYQGTGRGLSLDVVNRGLPSGSLRKLCRDAVRFKEISQPDLTFLLDIEPKSAFARVKKADRIESLGLSFQKKVREGYLKLAQKEPARIKVISACGSPDEIFGSLIPFLNKLTVKEQKM
ncbi:MAG: dTMP kinase [Candidatus Omnitrophota bacterium]